MMARHPAAPQSDMAQHSDAEVNPMQQLQSMCTYTGVHVSLVSACEDRALTTLTRCIRQDRPFIDAQTATLVHRAGAQLCSGIVADSSCQHADAPSLTLRPDCEQAFSTCAAWIVMKSALFHRHRIRACVLYSSCARGYACTLEIPRLVQPQLVCRASLQRLS